MSFSSLCAAASSALPATTTPAEPKAPVSYRATSVSDWRMTIRSTVVLSAVAGRLLGGRSGGPLLLVTAVIALWAGLTLLPVLTHGYALVVLPLFLVRVIAAALLGGALSLVLFAVRMLDRVAA